MKWIIVWWLYAHAANPKTPKSGLKSEKQRLSRFDSPVFLSDSDDDSDLVIKSTWRTRHSRPSSQEKDTSAKENKPRNTSCFVSPLVSVYTPKPSSAPPTSSGRHEDTGSSEEEFQSLIDRIKKKQFISGRTLLFSFFVHVYRWIKVTFLLPCWFWFLLEPKPAAACMTPSVKAQKDNDRVPVKASQVIRTPAQLPISRPMSQTEPRAGHSSRYTSLCLKEMNKHMILLLFIEH